MSRTLLLAPVDPLPADAPLPRDLEGVSTRQTDLTFACQTERSLRALARIAAAQASQPFQVDIVRTSYAGGSHETAMKSWDFSESALSRRWAAGRDDMAAAMCVFQTQVGRGTGLVVHPVVRAARAFG